MNIIEAWSTPEVIAHLLRKVGIRADLLGYDYLCTAIELAVDDIMYLHCITKDLYPEVARAHGTTAHRVERAIRHSIGAMLDDGRAALSAYEVINLPTNGITNGMFIAALVRLITREPHHPIFEVRDYR